MFNKYIPFVLISMFLCATAAGAESFTETRSFILSVKIPQSITVPAKISEASFNISGTQQQNYPSVQEQLLVRNNQAIIVRSVVVL